jgi:hypothetical protein
MSGVTEEIYRAIADAGADADRDALKAHQILAENIALSSSDHATGWALLALFHEMRATRIMLADNLASIGASVEQTAALTADTAPRKRGGSW